MSEPWETVTPQEIESASRVGPIREAIYMGDHGQECVCSPRGKCYMHAQQERAVAALNEVEARCEQAIDALREAEEWAYELGHDQLGERLRAALLSLGEHPQP